MIASEYLFDIYSWAIIVQSIKEENLLNNVTYIGNYLFLEFRGDNKWQTIQANETSVKGSVPWRLLDNIYKIFILIL